MPEAWDPVTGEPVPWSPPIGKPYDSTSPRPKPTPASPLGAPMHYRNKRTKAVCEVKGNTPEGRDLAKSDDWDKVEGPAGVDEEEQMPAGVQQPPEPTA